MNKSLETINVNLFGDEIGRLAYDAQKAESYFQYREAFLDSGKYSNIFPLIIKRIPQTQVFNQFREHSFRGLPPMIADSLPDDFGNQVFNQWIRAKNIDKAKLSPILQLAYLSNRGMGALEYAPGKPLPKAGDINLTAITEVLKRVLDVKTAQQELQLTDLALLNIFKLGSSPGGARPKVIVTEHKESKKLIPGDVEYSDDYNHYLVKLHMNADDGYSRERVEYGYYQLALAAGLDMMPSQLVENKHFATRRFDRVAGEKVHILTATGLSGYNFQDPTVSSYENLFDLAHRINLPPADMDALFRRMVFNFVFHNTDDHLKNHAFCYEKATNRWRIAPSYDINYALNALRKWPNAPHMLSLNDKNAGITSDDWMPLAEKYTIKSPEKINKQVTEAKSLWETIAKDLDIPERVWTAIQEDFLEG